MTTIARAVRTVVRTTVPMVRLEVAPTPQARGFARAPRHTQERRGWRHPVYGNREKWVTQKGRPDWFTDAVKGDRERYTAAALDALEDFGDALADAID
jgi:hypothetical protein